MKARIFIIVILFIAGIGIMLYPTYTKYKTAKKQESMMSDLKDQIKKNKKKQSDNKEDSNGEVKKSAYDPELVKQEVELLQLEENENVTEKYNKEELLKQQKVIGIINIPSINIEFPIVEGSNRANIAVAIGHMKGTSAIGGEGNCVLAGHHGGIYGKFFKELEKVDKKDKVVLTDEYGTSYNYIVYESFKVKPSDVYVTDNMEGYILTMITCQDNGKNRLVVRAKLDK